MTSENPNQKYGDIVTTTFELPIGYTDESGVVHKKIVMRRMKNSDIRKVKNDTRIQQIMQQEYKGFGSNPVTTTLGMMDMKTMYMILFAYLTLEFGTLPKEKITLEVFDELDRAEYSLVLNKYLKLNDIVIPEAKEGGAEANPFAGLLSV